MKIFILNEECDIGEIKQENEAFIIAKNGIFRKVRTHLFNSIVEVNRLPGLKVIKPFGQMNMPKLTKHQISQVISFFHDVNARLHSECMVLIYYNPEIRQVELRAPERQFVTGGSIKYHMYPPSQDGFLLCGSIHSHSSMGAFHSGTDIRDEIDFDGLHITFGSFDSDDFKFSVSSELALYDGRVTYSHNNWFDDQLVYAETRVSKYQNFQYEGFGYGGYCGNQFRNTFEKQLHDSKTAQDANRKLSGNVKFTPTPKVKEKSRVDKSLLEKAINRGKCLIIKSQNGKTIEVSIEKKESVPKIQAKSKEIVTISKPADVKPNQSAETNTNTNVTAKQQPWVGNIVNQKIPSRVGQPYAENSGRVLIEIPNFEKVEYPKEWMDSIQNIQNRRFVESKLKKETNIDLYFYDDLDDYNERDMEFFDTLMYY